MIEAFQPIIGLDKKNVTKSTGLDLAKLINSQSKPYRCVRE